MTRYQMRVKEYLKAAGGSAEVSAVLNVCTIFQLERLEADGFVTVDGHLMGSIVTWKGTSK